MGAFIHHQPTSSKSQPFHLPSLFGRNPLSASPPPVTSKTHDPSPSAEQPSASRSPRYVMERYVEKDMASSSGPRESASGAKQVRKPRGPCGFREMTAQGMLFVFCLYTYTYIYISLHIIYVCVYTYISVCVYVEKLIENGNSLCNHSRGRVSWTWVEEGPSLYVRPPCI